MDQELLPYAVAKLLSENPELSQAGISEILDTSQPQVSRIVSDLKQNGRLAAHWQVTPSFRANPAWSLMEDELYGVSKIGQAVARLSPFPDRFRLKVVGATQDDFHMSPDDFGKAAAAVVSELIAPVSRIGVGCGQTIEAVIRGITPSARNDSDPKKRIIPILAEPAHLRNIDQSPSYSSTHMAESLQRAFYGEPQPGMPVLRGVIAYLPRRYRTREIMQLVQEVPGYQSIFLGSPKKNAPAEIDELECILTGAGAVSPGDEERQGTLIRERLEQENHVSVKLKDRITATQLDKLIYGDLAGILIPREKLSPGDAALVEELNEGLVGLKASHLKDVCARVGKGQRSTKRSPGVILAAFGKQKMNLIAAGIKAGLVSTLVTTKRCVELLAARVPAKR